MSNLPQTTDHKAAVPKPLPVLRTPHIPSQMRIPLGYFGNIALFPRTIHAIQMLSWTSSRFQLSPNPLDPT